MGVQRARLFSSGPLNNIYIIFWTGHEVPLTNNYFVRFFSFSVSQGGEAAAGQDRAVAANNKCSRIFMNLSDTGFCIIKEEKTGNFADSNISLTGSLPGNISRRLDSLRSLKGLWV